MIDPAALPEWAAILVAVLILAGALITLIGAVGLVRFSSFYQRIHAPTLGSSLGAAFVLLASSLYSSLALGQPVFHEALVVVFIIVTTPVTLMLLARATLYRDRAEGLSRVSVEGRAEQPGEPD
ncbi:MAG: cation:proton antiporter [Hyphomicrobiales bacterium]|nr:MAG: cation:proton antiporter [Hyphomicrobiales bacterium]